MRNAGLAYILWLACIVGFCGIHRFYAGKMLTGLLWLFTFGLLGIGQLIDLFLIPGMIDQANAELGYGGRRLRRRSRSPARYDDDEPRESRGPEDDFNFD